MHQFPHRGFLFVWNELLVLPLVAEGRCPTEGLAQFRTNRH